MRHKIIETSKGTFMIVDVTNYDGCIEMFCAINYKTQPIHFDGITEEQAKEVVDESVHIGLFAHYVKDVPVNTYCYRTATESLRWLLVSIGVEFKYERIDESMFYKRHSDSMSWGEYLTKEAQSKVWNKQQTYLFKKV